MYAIEAIPINKINETKDDFKMYSPIVELGLCMKFGSEKF